MNRDEIMGILPHRECMLLLDDVEEMDGNAVGHYHVRGDEFFLKGHFPGEPLVPGVILCEIMAQAACVLVRGEDESRRPLYTGLDRVRFRYPVRPGDVIEIRCEISRVMHPFYFAKGVASVGDRVCANADFSFALMEA